MSGWHRIACCFQWRAIQWLDVAQGWRGLEFRVLGFRDRGLQSKDLGGMKDMLIAELICCSKARGISGL